MEAAFDRLALLFRESDLVHEEQWNNYVRSSGGGKDILNVLQQDISLATLKDFLFAEIPVPFSRSRKNPLHEALSSQIRLTPVEMLTVLRAFQPPVETLTAPLIAARLVNESDVQGALRRHDLTRTDPYEQLLRQNVLTPDQVARFFSQPNLRRQWPYRHDLMLSMLECNNLISAEDVRAIREAPDVVRALSDYFSQNATVLEVLNQAKNGLQLPRIEFSAETIDVDLVRRFPGGLAQRGRFLPIAEGENSLQIVFADPLNLAMGDLLALLTGRRIVAYAAPAEAIIPILQSIFATGASGGEEVQELARGEMAVDSSSTVQLVSSIIENAIDLKATDIHMEPRDDGGMRVRYRIDGRLRNILRLPPESVAQIVSRIKVLADLDVTERRRPQDGHFDLDAGEMRFDFRISTLPCHLGEKIVIRVLDESRVGHGLGDLGLLDAQRKTLEKLCQFPYGMILTTGPTGSGKTSTLYACLATVNSLETNIVTIEDPIEYQLSGVNQVAVNPEIELGFAQGLRAILRQDPDVIMVGEIRDTETAAIAVRAALTGHLVFSTLHSNTAVGAFGTLNHMGIPPYMSAAATIAVVAQRLIRKICPKCRESVKCDPALGSMLWPNDALPREVMQGAGCESCMGSGYRGRTGLYEVVEINRDLRQLAAENASEALLIEAAAENENHISMVQAGREKVLSGETTLEEVCQQILTVISDR